MKHSESILHIAPALALAQGSMRNPEKNRTVKVTTKTGSGYSFDYATLDAILDIARPALTSNGIALLQFVDGPIESPSLTTRLLHSSGEWIETSLLLTVEENTNKGLASAITYARRYGLVPLLGLAAEEDDDGNSGQAHVAPRQPVRRNAPSQRKLVMDRLNLAAAQGTAAVREAYKLLTPDERAQCTAEDIAAIKAAAAQHDEPTPIGPDHGDAWEGEPE